MKIVIIEDEFLTAEDLKDVILQAYPNAEIEAILYSVSEAVKYFQNNSLPQLIFSDIQLGDGLSFEIYDKLELKVPIIFCTAYDEYAIEAFNTNGIHYVLKPFDLQKIREAIDKFINLQVSFATWHKSLENAFESLQNAQQQNKKTTSLLVYYQNKVIPIKLNDVALFYIKNDATLMYTFDLKTYVVNKTLDEIQQFDTDLFYRANRQFIINKNAVKEVEHQLARKVSIELNLPFSESITISKEKITSFFEWLTSGQ